MSDPLLSYDDALADFLQASVRRLQAERDALAELVRLATEVPEEPVIKIARKGINTSDQGLEPCHDAVDWWATSDVWVTPEQADLILRVLAEGGDAS